MLWPAGLSADYSFNQVPVSTGLATLLAVLLWIAIAGAAILAYRRARPVFFLIAFFAVTIAPVANIAILVGSIKAERFLYLPSVGFVGCLVWLGRRAPARWSAIALGIVCLALAARTYARNNDWYDERSLWTSAVQVTPQQLQDSPKTWR